MLENKYDSKFIGLKYFNVFGPNENHKGDMRSMVNKAYTQIKDTGRLKLFRSLKPEFKDGEQQRDFVYVKDAVDMTLFFDPADKTGGSKTGIYNIGSGTASSWLQAANAVFAAMGVKPEIEFIDMPENIMNQYQYYSKAEMEKLISAGYNKPCMKLEDSITDYVQKYIMTEKYLTV